MQIDPKKKYTATFETSRGIIVTDLFPDAAPNTVTIFVFLPRMLLQRNKFHRVIPDFMVQGGDPRGHRQRRAGI